MGWIRRRQCIDLGVRWSHGPPTECYPPKMEPTPSAGFGPLLFCEGVRKTIRGIKWTAGI